MDIVNLVTNNDKIQYNPNTSIYIMPEYIMHLGCIGKRGETAVLQ